MPESDARSVLLFIPGTGPGPGSGKSSGSVQSSLNFSPHQPVSLVVALLVSRILLPVVALVSDAIDPFHLNLTRMRKGLVVGAICRKWGGGDASAGLLGERIAY